MIRNCLFKVFRNTWVSSGQNHRRQPAHVEDELSLSVNLKYCNADGINLVMEKLSITGYFGEYILGTSSASFIYNTCYSTGMHNIA